MGKSTISMAIFNSYVSLPEGTTSIHHQELNRQLLNSAKSGDVGQASMALQVTGDRRTGRVGLRGRQLSDQNGWVFWGLPSGELT